MLTIIIPCRNESLNIGSVLQEIRAELPKLSAELDSFKPFEVIVVDDGSSDGTADTARASSGDLAMRVVTTSGLGYGGALQAGISASSGDYVLIMDGDGQYPFANLHTLGKEMLRANADVVGGMRVQRADQFLRNVNGQLWTRSMAFLFQVPLRDLGCGFKLYRGPLLRKAMPFGSRGAFIWTESTVKLVRLGARFTDAPIEHKPRLHGTQSGNSLRVVGAAFRELVSFLLRSRSITP